MRDDRILAITMEQNGREQKLMFVTTQEGVEFEVNCTAPYADVVARKLIALGFRNVLHFVNQCILNEIPVRVIKKPKEYALYRDQDGFFYIQEKPVL